jgi:hypothetical protein
MVDVAAAAASILASWFAQESGRAAGEPGERDRQVLELRNYLRERLVRSSYAAAALERLTEDPANPRRQAALADGLEEAMGDDEVFRREIQARVDKLVGPDSGSVRIRGQDIAVGDIEGSVWGGRLPGDADEEY